MPHDIKQGVGKHEKKLWRALYALPLLGFVFAAHRTMHGALGALPSGDFLGSSLLLEKGLEVPLCLKYTGWEGLDGTLAMFAALFTSSIGDFDPAGRMQSIAFLAGDFVSLQVIFAIESARRGNFLTFAHVFPNVVLLLAQAKGFALAGPIYFFLHYVQSPLENYAAADNRTTDMRMSKTIIPTILLSYVVPTVAMYTVPGIVNRQWINGLFWQAFPIASAVLQHLLPLCIGQLNPEIYMHNPRADMPYLRRAYAFAMIVGGCAYWYVYLASPVPLTKVFFHDLGHPSAPATILSAWVKALRYDQLCSFGAGFIWTLLNFGDLKRADKLKAGWGTIAALLAGLTLALGPGAAMAGMWAWREEVLAGKRIEQISKK